MFGDPAAGDEVPGPQVQGPAWVWDWEGIQVLEYQIGAPNGGQDTGPELEVLG